MPKRDPATWPGPFLEFVRLFNAGQYWESHEVLEAPWRARRSDFYQGLIIYASAFVHAQRGNPTGVCKQLMKVQRKLPPYRPHYMGIDVDEVLAHTRQVLELVTGNPSLTGDRLRRAIPYPRLEPRVSLVRGDEPELCL